MNEEDISNVLLSKLERCSLEENTENIIYDGEWKCDKKLIDNLIHSFIQYKDELNIPTDKLDFGTYTPDFYKKKHPKFSNEVCEILSKCSKEKIRDERMKPFEKIDKETTISFS